MLGPRVRLQLPDGSVRVIGPGATLGRSASATVRLDDPGISELQALISLRGRHLKLLALRGMLRVGKTAATEVVLRPGLALSLTRTVSVRVLELELPDHILALRGFGPVPVELAAPIYSMTAGPRLEAGHLPDALGWVWSTDTGWRFRTGADAPRELTPGTHWALDGARIEAISVPLGSAAVPDTRRSQQLREPLKLVCRNDTVHAHLGARAPAVIDGLPARILSELAAFDAPTPWDWVAREIWGRELEPVALRQRWDRNLRRLRAALKEAGLDPGLVRADGSGNVELVTRTCDEVVPPT